MDNKNEFQELLDKLLKEQEEKLTKQFQHTLEQREQEWSSLLEAQTQAVATHVADHIGKEVVSSYEAKFGAEAEATQHAKDFPFQEQAQVALQLMRDDGQVMTADELIAKHSTTWDEFNFMGGMTNQVQQANDLDPFKVEPAGPGPAADLDQDTKDVMAAIDYQVQNYSTHDNFPIADEPAIATPTAFSKAQAQAAIASLRAGLSEDSTSTPAEAPKEAPQATKAALEEPALSMTKQDTEAMPSVTAEMLAATQEASQFIADAAFIQRNQGFGTITQYRTMSPNDERLSADTLAAEMSQEKFNVKGKSNELVNYFDKVRSFAFAGKTAEEHRAKSIEKNDIQEWLNSFQPARQAMKEAHESELKLMPFDAPDREVEQMKLKHNLEKKFFDYHEKKELFNAPQYFNNELLDRIPQVEAPTTQERKELETAFKDYAAHRLGKTWKHVYANQEQDPSNPKRMSKDALITAMKRNQELKNEIQPSREFKAPSQGQVKRKIQSLRMTM